MIEADPPILCSRCRDVIGVYEPIALVSFDGTPRATSVAEQGALPEESMPMHWECHERGFREASSNAHRS